MFKNISFKQGCCSIHIEQQYVLRYAEASELN